jgi:NAD(P)-dependent dehydrogenase (short-subunit alcohol dehydrogenase family)
MPMTWNADQIPNQDGRVAIVTGANSGIGLVAATELAAHGARVILACRSEKRASEALAKIRAGNPEAMVEFRALDLSSLESVQAFAEGILADEPRLDLLINNAGVMMPPTRSETADGFELQFGVNHLGHQALTALLIDRLNQTPGSRVVNVASQAHRGGKIDFEDLQWQGRGYRKMASYGQSKLANLLFTFELDRRLKTAGQTTLAVAAHPGWTATDLQRHSVSARFFNPLLAMKPAQGALPTLRAATDPEVKGGEYFGPCGVLELRGDPVKVSSSRRARDTASAARLWQVSEELTGVRFDGLSG